ncbi:glycerate kinase type-2 family protein [Kaarinaea lacus]
MNINESRRSEFISIFSDALHAVNGARCTALYLQKNPIMDDVCLVAIGKAACSMASGARSVLGEQIKDSLVITKHGCCRPMLADLNVLEAGHPLPDEHSLEAGRRLLELLHSVPAYQEILVLISGGASALVEVLPASFKMNDLQRLNRWLLQSGIPITDINVLRKQVSSIKGGRLAKYMAEHHTTALLISDVQDDDPAVIGSGLLFPTATFSRSINEEELPGYIRHMLHQAPPMPGRDDNCFTKIKWEIIANLQQAVSAANRSAMQLGYETVVHEEYLQGDALECGKRIARNMQVQPGKLHIWGGETTVTLPKNPGKGGRCQSLALSAAIALQTTNDWCLLAAGTDGDDGVSGAAGACVDADSFRRAQSRLGNESNPLHYLRNANAGTYFEASGDLIQTGATGTNVTDIVFGFCNK